MPRKSYIILSLILASVMASMAMPASAFYNLLRNPGFETGSFTPWEADWEGDGGAVIISPGRTDNYAASMGGGAGGGWIWQDIDPPRCVKYLEFWYIYTQGYVVIYYSDGTTYEEFLPDAYTWTLVHIDLDTTKLVERVETSAGGYGGINVDDFDLEACVNLPVGGELTQSITPILNPLMVLVVIAVASSVVLGYRFTKRWLNRSFYSVLLDKSILTYSELIVEKKNKKFYRYGRSDNLKFSL